MNYTTWIEINQTALEHNIKQYRMWLPQQTKVAAVIKGNAYGHGLITMGKLLDDNPDILYLCVASSQEAVQLRLNNITKPILILGFIDTSVDDIIKYNLEMFVSDMQTLQHLHQLAQQYGVKINVHLKVDTGLARLGFLPDQAEQALEFIKQSAFLQLKGIGSHCIEACNPELVQQQEEILKPFWQSDSYVHIANSNSALHTKYTYSFARIGAGIYGYLPEAEPSKQQLLHPIIALKTKIIHIKKVPSNVSVGYGRTTYITQRPTIIATLGMGYFEGMDPDLLHCGKVLLHGQYASIIGRINMNYFMVDVTHIPQAQVHDVATVLGQDHDKYITAYDWRMGAKKNVRIFTSRLSSHIPQIVVRKPLINLHDSIMHNSQIEL